MSFTHDIHPKCLQHARCTEAVMCPPGRCVRCEAPPARASSGAVMVTPDGDADAARIAAALDDVVAAAQALGYVVAVEQRPLQPLAMRNTETVVTVRKAFTR